MLNYGYRPRSVFACDPHQSRGRLFPERDDPWRTAFQRDRDRIVHATAFRRLKHKTQVFVEHEGDHYRTRLTHSLEVAQIARSLARPFGLDEDLAEALALAHDLGHTPFGHAGERALHKCLKPWGGFDHNAQALRIVTLLEQRYPHFDGLNLTWEMLEGLVKHNGPLDPLSCHFLIRDFNNDYDLHLTSYASLEAQCAAIADDIAYNSHDLDDGLRAGLFHLDDLLPLPFFGDILRDIRHRFGVLETSRQQAVFIREVIVLFVHDVSTSLENNLTQSAIENVDHIRRFGRPLVGFSEALLEPLACLRLFLMEHMYRHPAVTKTMLEAESVVQRLFDAFYADPEKMPHDWQPQYRQGTAVVQLVADYIAGMTDRYALQEHKRLFDEAPWLR